MDPLPSGIEGNETVRIPDTPNYKGFKNFLSVSLHQENYANNEISTQSQIQIRL